MSKGPIDPNAIRALNEMKYEIANELGLPQSLKKSNDPLSSVENIFFGGYVGGNMTKKLIEIGEKLLTDQNKI